MRRLSLSRFLNRLSIGRALILIAVIGLVAGALWLNFAPDLAAGLGLSPEQWSALGSFTSAVAFAFATGTGIIALTQFSQAVDSRNLDIYQDVYEKLMHHDQIAARRLIYQKLARIEKPEALVAAVMDDEALRVAVKDVLNLFDYYGFIVQQDWVTEDEVIGWLSPVVVKIWEKIGPVVENERMRRLEEPDYYAAAIELADECRKWRDRHIPDWDRITFGDRL